MTPLRNPTAATPAGADSFERETLARTVNQPAHRSLDDQVDVPGSALAPVPQQQAPLGAQQPARSGDRVAREETFSREQESVARLDNVPLHPGLPGFFDIPGTPARFKVDGYVKLDAIFDNHPAGNPDQFDTGTIPIGLPSSKDVRNFSLHARQTRVNLDFRSPVNDAELRTFAEIDFYGTDGSNDPRLRHFYGQLQNLLVGQTWSTWNDPDTSPDTLDFAGPAGNSSVRQAQIRYTAPLSSSQSVAFGLEQPQVQAPNVTPDDAGYTPAPDAVVRYRLEEERGHVQIGSLFRALGYDTDTSKHTYFGWAVNGSAGFEMTEADTLLGYASYGEGYARYVSNLDGLNLDLGVDGSSVEPLPVFATYVGYTHRWNERWRSTVTFGFDEVDNSDFQPDTTFEQASYQSANLIWSLGSLNLGVELLHGTREQADGEDAGVTRLQFSLKYNFYRRNS